MIIVTVIETISIARVVTMTGLATYTATESGCPPPPEKARLANDGLSCFIPLCYIRARLSRFERTSKKYLSDYHSRRNQPVFQFALDGQPWRRCERHEGRTTD